MRSNNIKHLQYWQLSLNATCCSDICTKILTRHNCQQTTTIRKKMQNTIRSIFHPQLRQGQLAKLIASCQNCSLQKYNNSYFHSKEAHYFSSYSEQTASIDSKPTSATSTSEITIEEFAKINLLIGIIKQVSILLLFQLLR